MKKIALLACMAATGMFDAAAQTPITFNAKGLVVISDADMAASALVDGKLLRDNTAKDQLTAIKFPVERGSKGVGSALVSNSVLAHGKTLAVASTGGLAYVLESRIRPEDGVAEYKDVAKEFPAGEKLFVVDVSNPAAPKAKFGFPVGKKPLAIDVNKNELILSTSDAGKELVFIEAAPDGKPSRFLNLPAGIDSSSRIIDVTWHPSGDYIAFTLDNSREVGLYKVIREAGKLKNVELVGKPVKVGSEPGFGRFSPDGKHYFVLDTKAQSGKNVGPADVYVVDFSMDGAVEHKVSAPAAAGLNAGAFALSPDGGLLVTVNAGKSSAAWSEAGAGTGASLTLFKVGKMDGALSKVADYPFEGIYPQGIAFDKDGSNLAVSVFEYMEYGNGNGGVEFWTVTKGETPALKRQGARVSVGKGAHTLRIIP
ncbi:beta-propeller fold lactonase family protein [Dyadobacter sandarakinus]|uniref:Beta-propeller fold lactonase family protein n=1 Tax=Dyadobacter sandarakinus TaxID=2747268 RepID=A0ABX7I149_9BACT|nr:beta-propeller fold lactonase family protein [Dyadobacter sandarakinus]QRQ99614.1 beta-propeller fold lactonase family protein [Dyadobacter sandarakinus]